MIYDLSMRYCETCGRETLHVRAVRPTVARFLSTILTLGMWRAGRNGPAECVCCGTVPNPEGRHPFRLRLQAKGSLAEES